jgi:hypothetical protein
MRRYLVVANQTLGGGQLLQLLRHLAERPSSFHVLVPATPPSDHLWTEAEARGIARSRMETALERFRSIGAEEVTGEVGDARPLQAIDDVLSRESFDEIILSTLPPRLSRWLKLDLIHRVRAYGLPVQHVISQREMVAR